MIAPPHEISGALTKPNAKAMPDCTSNVAIIDMTNEVMTMIEVAMIILPAMREARLFFE